MKNLNSLRVVHRKNGTVFTLFRYYRRWFKIPHFVFVPPPERAARSTGASDDEG